MPVVASGTGGRLTAAGRPVAELAAWKLDRMGGEVSVVAQGRVVQRVWLSAKLTLELFAGSRVWRWRDAQAQESGDEILISAQGKMEVMRGPQ